MGLHFISNTSSIFIVFPDADCVCFLWSFFYCNVQCVWHLDNVKYHSFLFDKWPFAVASVMLLTVMAYDLYVTICHPLHYTVIMNPWHCGLLVLVSWIMSALYSLLQCLMVLDLSFCSDLEIPHFFCELKQVVQLACSDNFPNDLVMYFGAGLLAGGPLTGILYSYSKIISFTQAIPSAQGKFKAFSTCASHLSVVSLFYGTCLGVYLSSAGTRHSQSSTTASVMYTVVTHMLNPFIYSLRNKDIKRALERILGK